MTASIYCPHCQKHTALSLGGKWQSAPNQTWWIGICNSCRKPTLVLNNGEKVYPHPLPTPTDSNIPQELVKDLDESKLCFSTGCYRACSAMARRCIQSACILKGAKKSDLVQQISELAQTGVITKDIEEWATVVRWVGNDAAHPDKDEVTKEDAQDCLKLAEQFLHVIFVTPAVAKARRAARGK